MVSRGGLGFGTTALKRNFFDGLARGLGSFLMSALRTHEAPVLVSRGGLGFGTTALKRNFFDGLARGLGSFLPDSGSLRPLLFRLARAGRREFFDPWSFLPWGVLPR